MTAAEERDGVRLTNLDEPLAPDVGVTKRQLLDYLDASADRLVTHLADRPLSVVRVLRGQEPFMQKNVPKYAPDWIATTQVWAERSHRTISYPLCDDRRTLLWFGNQRSVEFHPTLYRASDPAHPTHLVIDLDPPEGQTFDVVRRAAHAVRAALAECGLSAAMKTSGSKGAHVIVPVVGLDREGAAAATRAVAVRAERIEPDLTTTAFIVDERHGKVFLDSTRAGGASVAAVYSPRLRQGCPVSHPVAWDDLDAVEPADFTLHSLAGQADDLWSRLLPAPQEVPESLVEEGRAVPVARVQAMHEGKRRAAARRRAEAPE